MYSLQRQNGDFLIEALIGTLITALVSLGTLAITSRIMLVQEEMVRQEAVVTTLREQLYNRNPFVAATVRCTAGNEVVTERQLRLKNRTEVIAINSIETCRPLDETYLHPVTMTPYRVSIEAVNLSIQVPTTKDPLVYELGVKQ